MTVAPMGVSFAQALIVLLGAAVWLLGAAWLRDWTIRQAVFVLPQAIVRDPLFAGFIQSTVRLIGSPMVCRSIAPSRAPPLPFMRPRWVNLSPDRPAISAG